MFAMQKPTPRDLVRLVGGLLVLLLTTAAPAAAQLEPVSWTAAVGVAVSGSSLTKTAPAGFNNAGAFSAQLIASGDGYVEFTASETTTYRMVGLSNGNADNSYADIDFGVDLAPNSGGHVFVYEKGINRGDFGAYVTGDVFRIAVTTGVVTYSKNGTVFYTSTQTPVYPLLVDSWLYTQGATLQDVVISGATALPSPAASPVEWVSAVGVQVDANSLTKTAVLGATNAGAVSTLEIVAGVAGYVEFTASETTTYRMVGLSHGNADNSYPDIDFGIDLSQGGGGRIVVYEKGSRRGDFGSYTTGDVLRVAVEGNVVTYSKNGTALYTSTQVPAYPLLVDSWLYNQGATIQNAIIAGGSTRVPPPAPTGDPVVWTSAVGVGVQGNSLSKTAPNGDGNAGAVSTQQITSGDGYVEFAASETNTYRMIGLSNGNTNSSYQDIDFGLDLQAGESGDALRVFENGIDRGGFGTYVTDDLLRVAVVGGVVTYSKNGAVFYTSSQTPTYPLLVDTWLYNQGATLRDVVISGAE
jgi:hypothetical protein